MRQIIPHHVGMYVCMYVCVMHENAIISCARCKRSITYDTGRPGADFFTY